MIPLRDNIPSRRFPVMNVALILITVFVFLYELSLSQPALQELFLRLGVVPSRVSAVFPSFSPMVWGDYRPLVTAMFLHGGWMHIIGNMVFLWVFGDNVEDLMGPWRYLAFYLLAGVLANLAHVYAAAGSSLPTVGASGAVAAVLGAYFINFSHARVLTLVPLGIFLTTVELPAAFFLLIWFILQLVNGVATLGVPNLAASGVAWWAHIGGFVAGALLVHLFRERRV